MAGNYIQGPIAAASLRPSVLSVLSVAASPAMPVLCPAFQTPLVGFWRPKLRAQTAPRDQAPHLDGAHTLEAPDNLYVLQPVSTTPPTSSAPIPASSSLFCNLSPRMDDLELTLLPQILMPDAAQVSKLEPTRC
ncbi:hypothetical protein B0H16DRAFT_1740562 [Mycena metata]|uniref:Uncharacterized protein n=1 Tax=Mycena metata TaxID=1033252 RepID=A0AAD7HDC0_9AGAR|nr:hypothetical protein B0H16DRAFT_1740562 [Mycena metata]